MKSVLITGCSSGIGHYTATHLKKAGYQVFATARKQTDVDTLNKEGLESVHLDLASSVSICEAVKTVLEKTGSGLYALINNGAYGLSGAVEDLSREALRQQFEVNLFGTHELTCQVLPSMRANKFGRIIQISSVQGFVAMKYRGAYCASKFALEGLSDTLRLELKDTGIHVSIIEPGPILSNFRKNAFDAYRQYIDRSTSSYKAVNDMLEEKLQKEGAVVAFTSGPDAVYKKIRHALESRRPKDRYYVTFPTYLFAYLKRILPGRWLDQVLERI